ncbi:MAG: AAA family ATPase [Nanoarchaeota archaeon]|jgi:septum site-determining protein MinD|nr:AAA family ATPase [Nanoarchaeota archaeon]
MGKVIGVISLKGGVGKTSSVVALGASLANLGKKVLLVDGNFSAPNLGLHLDIIEPEKTLHHVMAGEANVQDAIHEVMDFHVIPSSVFHNYNIDPLKLKNKLRSLRNQYDIILIDSSPAMNDETLSVILASDELLVVTTPDYSTLSMTLKSVNLAKKKGTQITGLILNKVHNKNFELSLGDVEKTSDVPVMAVIPHDVNVMKSQAHFTPSVYMRPRSSSSREYRKLAAMLIGERYTEPFSFGDLLTRISVPRQEINREIFYESTFN